MGRKRRKNVNKQSMYNIVQPLENGALLVYNTFSEAMVTMRKDYYEQYVERCEEGEDTKRLLEMGFITDSSVDEYFRVLCNFIKTDENQFDRQQADCAQANEVNGSFYRKLLDVIPNFSHVLPPGFCVWQPK